MERRELAASIFRTSHLAGEFRLRSGTLSGEYFDKYRFESDPRLLRAIADALPNNGTSHGVRQKGGEALRNLSAC
jgi:orotate phosphoribosyltransferase